MSSPSPGELAGPVPQVLCPGRLDGSAVSAADAKPVTVSGSAQAQARS